MKGMLASVTSLVVTSMKPPKIKNPTHSLSAVNDNFAMCCNPRCSNPEFNNYVCRNCMSAHSTIFLFCIPMGLGIALTVYLMFWVVRPNAAPKEPITKEKVENALEEVGLLPRDEEEEKEEKDKDDDEYGPPFVPWYLHEEDKGPWNQSRVKYE